MRELFDRHFAIIVVSLLFVIRLIGITNPPLEIEHNWRQVTGLMVSRIFVEQGPDLLHPRVEDNQGGSGIIGMEFPAMNYLYYLVSMLFGYDHWYGRLINLLISSFGLLAFFNIVKSLFSAKVAKVALLLLSCSIWFSFSRKMMPDTFALSLTMIGVWFGILYTEKGKWLHLLTFFIFIALGLLTKIPSAVLGALLMIPLFDIGIVRQRKFAIYIVGIISVLPALWWYFSWNEHLAETYGYWYNSGETFQIGLHSILAEPKQFVKQFIFNGFKSYAVFIVYFIGCLYTMVKLRQTSSKEKLFVAATLVLGGMYIIRSGHFFVDHDYYMLPLLPFLALLGGYAVVTINRKWIFALVAIGMVEGIANQQHEFFINDSEQYKLALERIADEHIPHGALIVINGNGNPQQLYFSHRKGWNISDAEAGSLDFIRSLKKTGASYLIINRESQIQHQIPVLYSDDHYQIFDLRILEEKDV